MRSCLIRFILLRVEFAVKDEPYKGINTTILILPREISPEFNEIYLWPPKKTVDAYSHKHKERVNLMLERIELSCDAHEATILPIE
jgi:hypothetical protein